MLIWLGPSRVAERQRVARLATATDGRRARAPRLGQLVHDSARTELLSRPLLHEGPGSGQASPLVAPPIPALVAPAAPAVPPILAAAVETSMAAATAAMDISDGAACEPMTDVG